jgi:hypothetical protein
MTFFVNKYFSYQEYAISYIQENVELFIYSMLAFTIPFFIGHPQWFVGVVVNTSLVLAGLNIKNYKVLPVIILPSLAVLSRGLIFGPFTIFLLYIIPFIWFGNALILLSFKIFTNKFLATFVGSFSKFLFLFVAAFVLINLNILPQIFIVSMGVMQLYTALVGSCIALGVHSLKKSFSN